MLQETEKGYPALFGATRGGRPWILSIMLTNLGKKKFFHQNARGGVKNRFEGLFWSS